MALGEGLLEELEALRDEIGTLLVEMRRGLEELRRIRSDAGAIRRCVIGEA